MQTTIMTDIYVVILGEGEKGRRGRGGEERGRGEGERRRGEGMKCYRIHLCFMTESIKNIAIP